MVVRVGPPTIREGCHRDSRSDACVKSMVGESRHAAVSRERLVADLVLREQRRACLRTAQRRT
jgi:hypothetical protein